MIFLSSVSQLIPQEIYKLRVTHLQGVWVSESEFKGPPHHLLFYQMSTPMHPPDSQYVYRPGLARDT